jgi:hypothetical protein
MTVDKLLMGFPQKTAGSNPAGGAGIVAVKTGEIAHRTKIRAIYVLFTSPQRSSMAGSGRRVTIQRPVVLQEERELPLLGQLFDCILNPHPIPADRMVPGHPPPLGAGSSTKAP